MEREFLDGSETGGRETSWEMTLAKTVQCR